jgi:hypothetical protein
VRVAHRVVGPAKGARAVRPALCMTLPRRAVAEPGQVPPGAAVFGQGPALGAAGHGPHTKAADHCRQANRSPVKLQTGNLNGHSWSPAFICAPRSGGRLLASVNTTIPAAAAAGY